MEFQFYEESYPKVGQVVMCIVKSLDDNSITVELLEYNNLQGMILMSELTKRRIRSIKQITEIGKIEAVVVTKIDTNTNCIDLSKKAASLEEITICQNNYNKAKIVNNIVKHFTEVNNLDILQFYQNIIWPLYKKYTHCYEAFKLLIDSFDIFKDLIIEEQIKIILTEYILKKMKIQDSKICAKIDLKCFEYEGIDAIKNSLNLALQKCNNLKIIYLAAPEYLLCYQTNNLEKGIFILNEVIETIRTDIVKNGGSLNVIEDPKVLSNNDLKILIEEAEE